MLSSLEELSITCVAGVNPFARVLNPRVGGACIVINRQDCFVVSQLISVARHAGLFKLGSKVAKLFANIDILPLSHFGNLRQLGDYNALYNNTHTHVPKKKFRHKFKPGRT